MFFVVLGVGIYFHANLWTDDQSIWSGDWTDWRIWTIIYYPYWQLYGEMNLGILEGINTWVFLFCAHLPWLGCIYFLLYLFEQRSWYTFIFVNINKYIYIINASAKTKSSLNRWTNTMYVLLNSGKYDLNRFLIHSDLGFIWALFIKAR